MSRIEDFDPDVSIHIEENGDVHVLGGCISCAESFSVWVQVESEALGEHDNIGLPDKLATFDTFEEAAAFIREMPAWQNSGEAATSDYREENQHDCDRYCRILGCDDGLTLEHTNKDTCGCGGNCACG